MLDGLVCRDCVDLVYLKGDLAGMGRPSVEASDVVSVDPLRTA